MRLAIKEGLQKPCVNCLTPPFYKEEFFTSSLVFWCSAPFYWKILLSLSKIGSRHLASCFQEPCPATKQSLSGWTKV